MSSICNGSSPSRKDLCYGNPPSDSRYETDIKHLSVDYSTESEYEWDSRLYPEDHSDEVLDDKDSQASTNIHIATTPAARKENSAANGTKYKKHTNSCFAYLGSAIVGALKFLGKLLQLSTVVILANNNKKSITGKSTRSKKIINQSQSSGLKRTSKRKRITTEVWLNPERRIKPKSRSASRRSRREVRANYEKIPETASKVESLGIGPRAKLAKIKGVTKSSIKKPHETIRGIILYSISLIISLTISVATSATFHRISSFSNCKKTDTSSSIISIVVYSIAIFPIIALPLCSHTKKKHLL